MNERQFSQSFNSSASQFEATFICLGSMYNLRSRRFPKHSIRRRQAIVFRLAMAERNDQDDIQALNRTIPVASSATGKLALAAFGLILPCRRAGRCWPCADTHNHRHAWRNGSLLRRFCSASIACQCGLALQQSIRQKQGD